MRDLDRAREQVRRLDKPAALMGSLWRSAHHGKENAARRWAADALGLAVAA
ncbi:hypothetical protein [Muricoccus pecuniae]|uniref:Uncharacterized protein n=1 Tax=Muricoccus pecuniae TaxID=693023 RepID=A0A840Y405_9PROT|nr:hypothetical protein [Roseomonas pecuniae]MBB5695455.1 hypothetical protein [Roseomonas pecuniae]